MRRVTGRTDHVVIVGAGLGGLAAALHLAGAGRQVTLLEREQVPGGRAGLLSDSGYRFDTGPTVLTMPSLIEETFAAVGESLSDWITLTALDPAYRAWFPDGSSLDVIADPQRMSEQIARVCGAAEAKGYLRFVAYARRLWRAGFNFDSPRDLMAGNLFRLASFNRYFKDPRTRATVSFPAMYTGLAPAVAYLGSVTGACFPEGGFHSLPSAMASAATKHGVDIHYGTTVTSVETRFGRADAVITSTGCRIPADVVVLNPDLPTAYALLPGRGYRRPLRYSPSCVVLHIGSSSVYRKTAHQNIHFGRSWQRVFDEVVKRGELMSDPCLLVTNPSYTDPSLAPSGRQTYHVLAPAPNLATGPNLPWRNGFAARYTDYLLDALEARGYHGFASGVEVLHTITPATWACTGLAAGTPFAAAHTFSQTGPFRSGNLHPALSNVVFVGAGTQPGAGVPMVLISGKLAATRITG